MSDFPIFCYYQLAISGLKLLNLKGVGKSMTFKVGMKYMFKNKNSRKYLDISGNQTGNNANVQQYEYLADAPSERFFLHPLEGYGNDSQNNPPHLKNFPIAAGTYYTLSCSFLYKADLETLVISQICFTVIFPSSYSLSA